MMSIRSFFGFDIPYLRDPLPTDIEYINNRRSCMKNINIEELYATIVERIIDTGEKFKVTRV